MCVYEMCTHAKGVIMSMTKTGDSIKFEYRSEVDEVENALEIYLKEHPTESNKETVKRMIDLLEVMYLEW